jgi:hypothetical protein
VFRELLQNSDDAQSKAVEIHFETKQFIDRKNSVSNLSGTGGKDSVTEVLPDLKTALVCEHPFRLDKCYSNFCDRFISGPLRITE